MKTSKWNLIIMFVVSVISFCGCVQDDDFKVPDTVVADPVIPGTIIDIDAVLGSVNQANIGNNNMDAIITFEATNTYMLGYVISSDEAGNFFEELILQDRPENPTAGINVQIDVSPLFTIYNFGRKIYVKLDGLSAGVSNGVITIGRRDGERIEKISGAKMTEHLIRTPEVASIVPLVVDINDFSNELESLYIQLNNVQFGASEVLGDNPKTFAAEDDDEFDGERLLQNCTEGGSVILSTSTFSDFKGLLLPANQGSIKGVLTRNFFDTFYTMYINSPEDITFDTDERCGCGLESTVGTSNLFIDNFETQTLNTLITGNGWTNYIEAGSTGWEAYTATGTNASLGKSARCSGRFSNGDSNVAWLITPAVDLDTTTNETLRFKTSNSFSDSSTLVVLYSDNWDGTVAGVNLASWKPIVDATIVQDSDFFGDWINSGPISLDCLSGIINVAFKYQGSSDEDFDGTYELDDISIDAQ